MEEKHALANAFCESGVVLQTSQMRRSSGILSLRNVAESLEVDREDILVTHGALPSMSKAWQDMGLIEDSSVQRLLAPAQVPKKAVAESILLVETVLQFVGSAHKITKSLSLLALIQNCDDESRLDYECRADMESVAGEAVDTASNVGPFIANTFMINGINATLHLYSELMQLSSATIEDILVSFAQRSMGSLSDIRIGPPGTGKSRVVCYEILLRNACFSPQRELIWCVQNATARTLAEGFHAITGEGTPVNGVTGRLPGYYEANKSVATPLDMNRK